MDLSILIMSLVMLITLISPFAVYYGIQYARKKDFAKHKKVQGIIFLVCILGLFSLEGLIRYSGGSGSIAQNSEHYGTAYFTLILTSHIIVATLSYILWAILIFRARRKYTKELPGKHSRFHKRTAYVVFGGLIYTAVTALLVYLMSLNII